MLYNTIAYCARYFANVAHLLDVGETCGFKVSYKWCTSPRCLWRHVVCTVAPLLVRTSLIVKVNFYRQGIWQYIILRNLVRAFDSTLFCAIWSIYGNRSTLLVHTSQNFCCQPEFQAFITIAFQKIMFYHITKSTEQGASMPKHSTLLHDITSWSSNSWIAIHHHSTVEPYMVLIHHGTSLDHRTHT